MKLRKQNVFCNEDSKYFYEGNLDIDEVLYEIEKEIEYKQQKIKKEEKEISSKYKRRETKYRNLGCRILQGNDAFNEIQNSFSWSMIAINTDEIYSIEYSGSTYFNSDLDIQDFYTIRSIVNNQIRREVLWSFMLPDISKYKWAIKNYHTGIRLDHPDY